jgi:cardiolipin synthase
MNLMGQAALPWWHALELQLTALAGALCIVLTIPWILMTKKDSTSAVAWCLLVFFVPFVGSLCFIVFGYQHVHRPLRQKRVHLKRFRAAQPGANIAAPDTAVLDPVRQSIAVLAQRFGAFNVVPGNDITLYHDGTSAFEAVLAAVEAAQDHVHLEYFIIQPDASGTRLFELLERKARAGVEVRLLYDAMGSRRLNRRVLRPLGQAGVRHSVFLPLNPLRRRIQVNMRNHRKILVVDGCIAFSGGLNIGDEYLGKVSRFGYWRDTHIRLEGPAVQSLQQTFAEDWDFAAGEDVREVRYFPQLAEKGEWPAQIIASGPDQELNGIRELYFAAVLRAQRRLWIASPYFVPDAGLRDALCLAAYQGVDVRLLGQYHPDKWIPYFAGRYYWADMLAAGAKVYQYTKGMMHSKVILVDGEWASVGSANLDNRSLHLNFEVNTLLYSRELTAELESAFLTDLGEAVRLERDVYQYRPLTGRIIENGCRLLSPLL